MVAHTPLPSLAQLAALAAARGFCPAAPAEGFGGGYGLLRRYAGNAALGREAGGRELLGLFFAVCCSSGDVLQRVGA